MSRRVWDLAGCTTFACLVLAACGKLEESPRDQSGASGASAGLGGAGNGGASGGVSGRGGGAQLGGTNDTRGGGPSTAEGGASTAGGEGGTSTAGGEGGTSTAGGEGGTSTAGGEGGTTGRTIRYLSCGCGCCVGAIPPQRCAYPGFGPTIDELVGDDRAKRNDTAGCAAAGCSIGIDYFWCEPPPPQAEVASYEASVLIGGYDRLRLNKIGAVNCSTFTLVSPKLEGQELPVELPTDWAIEQITRMPCTSSATGPRAIGATGQVSLRVSGASCVVDAHVTAFFTNAQGGVEPEGFDAEGVPVNLSVERCK